MTRNSWLSSSRAAAARVLSASLSLRVSSTSSPFAQRKQGSTGVAATVSNDKNPATIVSLSLFPIRTEPDFCCGLAPDCNLATLLKGRSTICVAGSLSAYALRLKRGWTFPARSARCVSTRQQWWSAPVAVGVGFAFIRPGSELCQQEIQLQYEDGTFSGSGDCPNLTVGRGAQTGGRFRN